MGGDFGLCVDCISLPGSYNPSKKIYFSQLHREKAIFPKRHLARSFHEARRIYLGSPDRNVHKHTIFVVRRDTYFYCVSEDYLISSQPLVKIDFMPGRKKKG